MKVPVVKTPLSIIALFVVLIEAFLAYPVTQLGGTESLIIVVFMTTFPVFISANFFFILWHKPNNLYSPGEIAEASAVQRRIAAEVRTDELEEEVRRLRQRPAAAENALLPPAAVQQLSEQVQQATSSTAEIEQQVSARIQSAGSLDSTSVEEVKRAVKRRREETANEKAQQVRAKMQRFQRWLRQKGFTSLPEPPQIVIEAADYLNAYYDPSDATAHFGALISEDPDTIAHTYAKLVLLRVPQLRGYQGEAAALAEGLSDYLACSYSGDPRLGELFAKAAKLATGWIRNLEGLTTVDLALSEPHALGLVWAEACWALRERYGADKTDAAVRSVLERLPAQVTLSSAAWLLIEELSTLAGESEREKISAPFKERGITPKPPAAARAGGQRRARTPVAAARRSA